MTALRRAVVGDEGRLAVLSKMVHDLHLEHRPDQFMVTTVDELAVWYRGLLTQPTVLAWVAESAGETIGYVVAVFHERAESPVTRARKWWEVEQLAVAPRHRRQGVARALVRAVIAEATARGVTQVEATSWAFNVGAHEVFGRLGFIPKVIRFERGLGS